jgi:hypothetical protein
MNDVRADLKKNRLYLTIRDVADEEAEGVLREISLAVSRLVKGFTVLTDLTGYKPMSQETARGIRRAQQILMRGGAACAVRVTRSAVIEMQFARRAKSVGYMAKTVGTVEEGERVLDAWVAERGRALRKKAKPRPEPLPAMMDLFDWDE